MKYFFSIGLKNSGFKGISKAFYLVITIALLNAVVSSVLIFKNKKIIKHISEVINPYIDLLEKFNLLVTESKMFSTNWVYLQYNENDKQKLKDLIDIRFPNLKTQLLEFRKIHSEQFSNDSLPVVLNKFEALTVDEKEIMDLLAAFEDYENAMQKFGAEDIIESKVLPQTDSIMNQLQFIIHTSRNQAEDMKKDMLNSFDRLISLVLFISIGLLIFILFASHFIAKYIRHPVMKMKDMIYMLGRGELPKEELPVTKDIIGEMGYSVNNLSRNFSKTSHFANETGKGNFNAEFKPLSEKDSLGNALIDMRMSLKKYSEHMEHLVRERTNEVIEKSKKLEIAYKDIKDSINYAKKIQEAILPSNEALNTSLHPYFVFYKPKDIVSGDFYWFLKNSKNLFISVADCTGHGVPGAFMSMIGNTLLNEIVKEKEILEPDIVLNLLHQGIIYHLHQADKSSGSNDGMDIAFCKFDFDNMTLDYAGANRPVYLIRNGVLEEFQPDKMPIGGVQHALDRKFTSHNISLQQNDVVYLISDGYADQFGGPKGKKIMKRTLKDYILSIHHLPMNEQHYTLENYLHQWINHPNPSGEIYEQVDDITVIGVKV